MSRKHRDYTLIFIPPDRSKPFTFTIKRGVFYSLIVFVMIITVCILFLVVKSGSIAYHLSISEGLKAKNMMLKQENARIDSLVDKYNHIMELYSYFSRISRDYELDTVSTFSDTGKYSDVNTEKEDSLEKSLYRPLKYSEFVLTDKVFTIPNIRPVEGWISNRFSVGDNHKGVDFAAPEGTPVYSTAPGIVEEVSSESDLGKLIRIRHKSGYKTVYAHCSSIIAKEGDVVDRGQTIAFTGSSGYSSGPHLHYEIIKNRRNVNPENYFPE